MHLKTSATAALVLALALSGCKSSPLPDDTALNTALQAKLTGDTAIATEPIQTFVQGGVATLQGSVSSEAAKALAASDAGQVPGIKSVTNQLTVQAAQLTQPIPPPPVAAPTSAPAPPPVTRPTKPSARVEAPIKHPQQAYNPPPAPIERRPLPEQQAQQPIAPPLEHRPTPPPPPAFRNVTIPSGTTLPIRITQTLDSASTQPGDPFSGTIASDVVIDGLVAFPAGTTVSGKVDEVHEAAHFKGAALLTISLVSINRRGDRLPVTTDPFTKAAEGRGKNTAEKVGGGAAVGAILGGIFGGGKGAAIGGLAGGGLGAGAQGVTRGQQVQIPSETLIRFRLANPLDVRASTATTEGDANLQHHDSN
ncbi:BON domain-containing protein [Granulicella arctica]|uniref:BON domain-containing protein n=1 Tax=Granulicella arctica TaxID=940613 RepID=UPI0021DFDD66|nr:BON domain-containing protein [Granulicella arctica]